MKRSVSMALLLSLCWLGGLAAQGSSDEQALRARADEFVAAWSHHDAKGLAAIWAPDGDLINPFGRVAKGRKAIEALFVDEHAGMMKGTTFTIDSRETRMLDATTAIQDWEVTVGGMMPPGATAPMSLKHHVTVVCVKKNGSWWVAAARPVVYTPAPDAAHH